MTSLSLSGVIRPTPTKAEARLNKTQESTRDNKQLIGKQHADNQPEENTHHRDGKREKEEGLGRKQRVN